MGQGYTEKVFPAYMYHHAHLHGSLRPQLRGQDVEDGLGWTSTHVGTRVKIPKFIQIISKYHALCILTKSGSLSSNLSFLGLNMATMRPHSEGWRYQLGCQFTLALEEVVGEFICFWHLTPFPQLFLQSKLKESVGSLHLVPLSY
jgi:hypothetical protein